MTLAPDRPAPARFPPPPRPGRPAPVRAHPDAVLGLIAAGAVAVLALWWHDTPSISGFGDWLTNAGRITGLLAGYGVVVLVALMARIPPLERGIGADRLARWHARGGRYTVCLVIAHGLLIIWGYAVSAHTDVVHQTTTLLLSYPDVLAATVGGLLLVGVGAVSVRAARQRMSYETWYYLHFYTYLAVALAFSHQFATGADFMDNRRARLAWALLYAGVGLAIVWYRFVTPVRQALRHQLRVLAVQPEGFGVVSIVVVRPPPRRTAGRARTVLPLAVPDPRAVVGVGALLALRRPRPDLLRFTVKALGDHSRALAELRPGTRVVAEGPYGALTAAVRRRRKVLLIAGGVGITPLRALFQTLPAAPGDLTLLYRASTEWDVVFRRELEQLAAHRRATLHVLPGRRAELGWDPLSASALTANVPDLAAHDVYLCGPPGLTASVTEALRGAGVPRRQIHTESFEF